ncbi:putative aldouronate transport system permease protein [Paenibacillus sp. UNC496MF]|uniref:carbohydrate ABC transporter permease n=1 Tax=Paenibacillus sp. UNC496MF TaxID=1502753 RepID=UPI0008F07D4F|nr:carbohydrate ABC transporter permease [Paenibacillus sp. UNC496MF]SFJ85621.1 putative aldouronate transport system permease protein [Paenibacillus sp. UNC496MF]
MRIKASVPRRLFLAANLVFLLVVALLCIAPFINLLAVSFSDKTAVAAGEVTFFPVGFTTVSYEFITNTSKFFMSLLVSLRRTALGVPINLLLIILTAYPLSKSRTDFRPRSLFSWFFVVTILFNAGLIPTYMVVKSTGLIDSVWSLVLPGALPVFSMLVVMNYMRSLPKELLEAAYIDGAGHVQTLLRVVLPVSAPTIATVTLFAFVDHWNSWFDGMIYMNQIEKYPLQTYLQTVVVNPEEFIRNNTDLSGNLSKYLSLVSARTTGAAQMFLAMIPILCIYPYLQKYFTTGLVMGSVKE